MRRTATAPLAEQLACAAGDTADRLRSDLGRYHRRPASARPALQPRGGAQHARLIAARHGALDRGTPLLDVAGLRVEEREQQVPVEGQHDAGGQALRVQAGGRKLGDGLSDRAGEAPVEVDQGGDDGLAEGRELEGPADEGRNLGPVVEGEALGAAVGVVVGADVGRYDGRGVEGACDGGGVLGASVSVG